MYCWDHKIFVIRILLIFVILLSLKSNHIISIILLVFSLNKTKNKRYKRISIFVYKRLVHEIFLLTLWTLQDETICLRKTTITCPYLDIVHNRYNYLSFVYYRFYFLFSFLPMYVTLVWFTFTRNIFHLFIGISASISPTNTGFFSDSLNKS